MEVEHVQRLYQPDTVIVAQLRPRRLPHDRIHVYRINGLCVRVFVHDAPYRPEHIPHRLSEIFAPVSGNQNQTAVGGPVKLRVTVIGADRRFERVYGGVARDENRLRLFALP